MATRDDGARIRQVDFTIIQDPFTARHVDHMPRLSGDWSLIEICRVTLDSGVVGVGETIIQYTWGKVPAGAADRVRGRNVFDLLWDDSLGCGLQMAVWDAAGKQAGVPCHALFGQKVRDAAPISWWCLDFSPEEWQEEAKLAVGLGYTSLKLKGRPWRDVYEQVAAVLEVVPASVLIDIDFNASLANAATAVLYLRELEKHKNVAIVESPIPQGDVAGNKRIREMTTLPIAMHFGSPPIMTALQEEVCDGFVIGGGAAALMRQTTIAAAANKPFWLQLVGTGLTTAWTAQVGAAATHAQWPAVTCMHIWQDDLIERPLEISGGYMKVPGGPGLGVALDEAAVEKLRLPDQSTLPTRPKRSYAISWPQGTAPGTGGKPVPAGSGKVDGFEHDLFREYTHGNLPRFPSKVRLEQIVAGD
ncbi:MAG TPA: enolase C-terminal domain-like protein [Chloroflexota bacterium]|nr:enolase C-terminal domain-like protein [Chloroflexota bacterium]